MKQLRLTTTKAMAMLGILRPTADHTPLITHGNIGELFMDKIKARSVYIHGEAQSLAGFDIPTFIDGNLSQLELPLEQQDILLLLPSGEYKCKSEYYDEVGASNCYLITLATEESVYAK